jgi:thiol-disulfide isomerase/thioredoxin
MPIRSNSARTAALMALISLTTAMPSAAEDAAAKAASAPAAAAPVTPATGAQVLEAVRAAGTKVVLVNLWATWCTPCREEFPDLMRFYRANKDRGVTLLLVSGDFSTETDAVKEFLSSQGVNFASYLKSGKDEDFINTFDSSWSGALPATFVYDAKGQRQHSFLGPITYKSLEREIAPLLGATP